MTIPTSPVAPAAGLVRALGLLAAIALVVGDVIGTGVFLKARVMTCNVGTPGMVMAVWVAGALLSLTGALVYAELAAMMPAAGGEYVFIRNAYGPLWGFLYGWTRFFVASTGGVAGLAAGFAIFFNVIAGGGFAPRLFSAGAFGYTFDVSGVQAVAIAAIAVVTIVNSAAVVVGGRIASALAILKVTLVSGVGLAAMMFAQGTWGHFALTSAGGTCDGVAAAAQGGIAGFGAAMLGALWSYNGWNEVTFVGEEIKDPERNFPLAIIGGIGIIATLYIFANAAYFYVLTPAEVASVPASSAVATEVIARFVGPGAAVVMAGALAMSIFGSLQVSSLVCARIPYAMARDGLFFEWVSHVSPHTRVPVRALLAQSAWAVVLVLSGSYDVITDYAIFAVLIFVGLAIASVFVFRKRLPDAPRPYRTWGYPVIPVLFLLVCTWVVVNTVLTTPGRALAGLGLMALGLPFYWYWSRRAPIRNIQGGS